MSKTEKPLPADGPAEKPAAARATQTDKPAPPEASRPPSRPPSRPTEIGGRGGPDPTRFGDWEKNGRCVDF